MPGSTISSTSAAITAPPASIEPPGPKPFRPGPRSPAWPLGHKPSCDRPYVCLVATGANQVDGAPELVLDGRRWRCVAGTSGHRDPFRQEIDLLVLFRGW